VIADRMTLVKQATRILRADVPHTGRWAEPFVEILQHCPPLTVRNGLKSTSQRPSRRECTVAKSKLTQQAIACLDGFPPEGFVAVHGTHDKKEDCRESYPRQLGPGYIDLTAHTVVESDENRIARKGLALFHGCQNLPERDRVERTGHGLELPTESQSVRNAVIAQNP
jgi:hypothetical protein